MQDDVNYHCCHDVTILTQVQSRFPGLDEVGSVSELVEKLKVLGPDIANLLHLAEKRQKVSMCVMVSCYHGLLVQDLKSRRCSEELASARATLMRSSKMLMTSTKVPHGNRKHIDRLTQS